MISSQPAGQVGVLQFKPADLSSSLVHIDMQGRMSCIFQGSVRSSVPASAYLPLSLLSHEEADAVRRLKAYRYETVVVNARIYPIG